MTGASLTLGPGIIGQAEADRQTAALATDGGGGALQLGVGILGAPVSSGEAPQAPRAVRSVVEVAPVVEAVTNAGAIATGTDATPTSLAKAAEVVRSGNQAAVPGGRRTRGTGVPAKVPSMTEDEVQAMLAEDPDLWPNVLTVEAQRPDGPRAAVASFVLAASKMARDKLPAEIAAELEAVVAGVPPSVVVG